MKIYDIIPDPDVLMGLAPEELAYGLLQVASANLQRDHVHKSVIISLDPQPGKPHLYSHEQRTQMEVALIEAFHWLEVNGLLLPLPGTHVDNGYRMLSRHGKALRDRGKFDSYQKAAAFPKSMLHPIIADQVWLALARGDLSAAVFIAFRTVEESVREAGGFLNTDIGVDLMRKAFNPDSGPLRGDDTTQPKAEREALMHLFAGAIGSYKNPHSHRTVTINDHAEAQEMVVLASHLLRIIDARRP